MRDIDLLYSRMEEIGFNKPRVVLAIDGPCASGKSTLGAEICARVDGNLFHMDDYFLRPDQRTKERLEEVGGNVDRERFLAEVLLGIRRGREFSYRPYNCKTGMIEQRVTVKPKKWNIVEGAYSLHPELSPYYDFRVFLEVDKGEQSLRILKRNGPDMHQRFLSEWIPLENRYFEAMGIRDKCDLIIRNSLTQI